MTDIAHDLGDLRTHQGSLAARSAEVKQASSGLGSIGAGGHEMYGLIVGPFVFPILEMAADGGENMASSLSDLTEKMNETMGKIITSYEMTEADHVDRTQEIADQLNQSGE